MRAAPAKIFGLSVVITSVLACSGNDTQTGAPVTTSTGGTVQPIAGATSTNASIGGASTATYSSATGGMTQATTAAPSGGSSAGGAATGGTAIGGSVPTTALGGSSGAGGLTSTGGSSSRGGTSTTGGSTARGGSSAVGGTPNAGGSTSRGGSSAVGGSSPFVLDWEDDFTTWNSANWALQSFTWDGNLATFSPTNVAVANGVLTMSLTNAAVGSTKPYLGVEARSTKTITYGKISARMRFAKGSGVVSGLVLFYTPYPNCDWNEIDIEHLGNSATSSQLNAMVFAGTYNPSCTASVTPTQEPLVTSLGFDAEADYHLYDVEWTPASVKYYADGVLLRTWTTNISLLKRPMNVLLTIWASDAASWAGPINSSSVPTTAQVDWIKVYTYNG